MAQGIVAFPGEPESRGYPPTAIRVLDLVEAVLRDPFEGAGKPEPPRYLLGGCWSRRITQEHRLVYRVGDEGIDFLQARYTIEPWPGVHCPDSVWASRRPAHD
ncbi:hypothetical protein SBA6_110057 [Candidatus Sulfopaludibacter sp. SbA6]|nr:hypothetical protein SBA6_110057 [Candidatus Sulfopaludibacter sp. SbA6]